ncbi:hypothetical protein [Sulfobacillus harzensis]|uniref:Uncharacterized protein n=1 Tax=Sulfobacillus harzensis TaxID=2729629 RepID=A0A7Y0L8A7_9FIRM|nr:hypothetical protein [Sulfobacillus harzensis]NMP25163.1 hypothetical protein [Sulfobacillus harzensis]
MATAVGVANFGLLRVVPTRHVWATSIGQQVSIPHHVTHSASSLARVQPQLS